MKNLLVGMTALGIALVGLHFLGVNLPLFTWIDSWGEPVARSIRAAIAAVGVALYVLGVSQSPRENARRARRR